MLRCPYCYAEAKEEMRFCRHCGAPLTAAMLIVLPDTDRILEELETHFTEASAAFRTIAQLFISKPDGDRNEQIACFNKSCHYAEAFRKAAKMCRKYRNNPAEPERRHSAVDETVRSGDLSEEIRMCGRRIEQIRKECLQLKQCGAEYEHLASGFSGLCSQVKDFLETVSETKQRKPAVPSPSFCVEERAVPPSFAAPAAQAERKPSLFRRLFQKKDKRDSRPPEPPAISEVQFSAVLPEVFVKECYTEIELIMYEEVFRSVVDQSGRRSGQRMQTVTSGILEVAKHTSVRIELKAADPQITGAEVEQFWYGKYSRFQFHVYVPEDYRKPQILFTAAIFFDGVPAARLEFTAEVTASDVQKPQILRKDIMSAFVSYASPDRNQVISIVRGMKTIRPDLNIFLDVASLRSGEYWQDALRTAIDARDVLFLFWSQNAKESKWVDFEWRYALERKGVDAIEPVPIEPPEVCRPPCELEMKHFNDALLYIMKNKN